jgi:hypothetical protein
MILSWPKWQSSKRRKEVSGVESIDCSTRLTSTTAPALKAAGIVAVGRYLGFKNHVWSKTLTPDELKAIHAVGLSVFLIWESNPTTVGYFSYSQGVSDAKSALDEAAYLGSPSSTAIYFTVDFDAQASDMAAIIKYFNGVRDGLTGHYLVGAYGSYRVLQALNASAYAPAKYFQTYAWSSGLVFPGNHIYQYQNDVTFQGINVDHDTIQNNSGSWPEIGGNKVLNIAVLLYTKDDFWSGIDVSVKNSNCAIFVRPADHSVPADAMNAKQLIVVGGPTTKHQNEVLLSGNNRYQTAAAVAKYLGI